MHLPAFYITLLFAALTLAVKASKYCDEFTSNCHPCTSEVRCFCRHSNKEVSLSCLNLTGSGRHYLQLLNYEGELICPTNYTFVKMMKKRSEIDETYEYKHMCRCTENIIEIASTDCNTNNGVNNGIAYIGRPTTKKKVDDKGYFPGFMDELELTTEPIDSVHSSQNSDNCHYPITWFLGSHCRDHKSISALVWALMAILIVQSFVIMSMLTYIIFGSRKHEPKIVYLEHVHNQGFELHSLNKALNDNNCGKDVENIYSEPVNINENPNGYLPMRSPLNCQYEEPINFKPCYINNKLVENSSVSSDPI